MNKGDNLYVQSMLDILQKEETQFISLTMNHEVDPAGGARKARDSHSMSSEKGSEMTRATGSDNRSSEIGKIKSLLLITVRSLFPIFMYQNK